MKRRNITSDSPVFAPDRIIELPPAADADEHQSRGDAEGRGQVQDLLTLPTLLLSQPVYRRILEKLVWPPEKGGLLLGPKDHEVVTHFHFDDRGQATDVSFTLDHVGLNGVLKTYVAAGLDCKGYVHVHPPGLDRPSYGDIAAILALFDKPRNRNLQRFLLPIVADGRLHPFMIERQDLHLGQDCARYARLVLF